MAPTTIHDRWLWVGLGIITFATVHGIRYAITTLVDLTEIDSLEHATDVSQTQPEDSISLEDLKVLAGSHNLNIANSAISLMIQRHKQDYAARARLTIDCQSNNAEIKERACTIAQFLKDWDMPPGRSASPVFSDYRDPGNGAGDWTRTFRSLTQSEGLSPREAMELVGELNHHGVNGFVPSVEHPIAGWTNIPRARPDDESGGDAEAEAERRRRRREAVVVHEGEGGIGEEDIIRPRG